MDGSTAHSGQRGSHASAVGATTAAFAPDSLAPAPDGSLVLSGTASDGPITIGGSTQTGATSIAVARVSARCPVVDSTRPTVTLTCSTGCAHVTGAALDDPVGQGVRRVLLGIERIAGSGCAAWNGRRFPRIACTRAAVRLVAVPLLRGAFRTPPLGAGRFVVRAVAIDGAGNRSRIAVRSVRRQ